MNCIDTIFDEFKEIKSDIEISISQMKADLGDMINHIVLYGAGSAGIAFLKYLNDVGIHPLYFADGKQEKWGIECQGLKIISPESIVQLVGENALVIVTINTDGKRYCKSFEETLRIAGHSGVHKLLRDCGCKNVIDYTYFRRCHSLFCNDPYNLPSCSDVELMVKNQSAVSKVYDWFDDDLSRETFEKIVRFRLIDDSISVPTLAQDEQYFESELYSVRDDACFVDCGAFNGISLDTFLKKNKKFEKYYGFEPDRFNFDNLQEHIYLFPDDVKSRCTIFNSAVYDKYGQAMLYSLEGPGSFMADIGKEVVNTVKIDDVLEGQKATYIKMNIEGSEIKALEGAENTIKTFKPDMAIAGYHKTLDLWSIPMLVKAYREDYKIYLRSYMNHISFVYYFR